MFEIDDSAAVFARAGRASVRPDECLPEHAECYVTIGRAGLSVNRQGERYGPWLSAKCAACNGYLQNAKPRHERNQRHLIALIADI
jgi:hypothetical protein